MRLVQATKKMSMDNKQDIKSNLIDLETNGQGHNDYILMG